MSFIPCINLLSIKLLNLLPACNNPVKAAFENIGQEENAGFKLTVFST